MNEENWDKYNDLVNRWSAIFKKRFGRLLDYDDIRQEAWVAVLQAEDYEKEYESTYLGTVIKNHLNKLLVRTIYQARVEGAELLEEKTPAPVSSNPESLAIAADLQKKLEIRISKIKHGLFVWKHMEQHSCREIAILAKKAGIPLSKSTVHRTIEKIREEYENI